MNAPATTQAEKNLDGLCEAVMNGVVRAYPRKDLYERAPEACRYMKEEVKAFMWGDEYANERDCVLRGSVHEGLIVASIVASVIKRLI